MDKVNDKILLITGASRGIGAATARLAGERGYSVCVNYRSDRPAAESVVDAIRSHGGTAIAVAADVGVEADVLHLFTTVDAELGPLTALVNNAGVLAQQTRLEHMAVERLERIFRTNVIGSMLCAREAVKRMSARYSADGVGGAIVNLSSAAARLGAPNEYLDYAASKGAIDTFTIGLAKEVAGAGIRVNAVRPGVIDTDIHASGGMPDRLAKLQHTIPMRRGGSALEVAETVLWLLSEQASYVTGALVDVAGGR